MNSNAHMDEIKHKHRYEQEILQCKTQQRYPPLVLEYCDLLLN